MLNTTLLFGDCLDWLPTIPTASVDVVLSDPPYAEVARPGWYYTESEWMELITETVRQARRILKPTGSLLYILQAGYDHVGQTKGWLSRFETWAFEYWNRVQYVYWFNSSALPTAGCEQRYGLLRQSVKSCVWLGPPSCYRNQDEVLWTESDWNREQRARERCDGRRNTASGHGRDRSKISGAAVERGGVTPYNLLIIPATGATNQGNHGHTAATPPDVCDWFVRYLCPPGGTVLDPFMGSGTVGLAALTYGCNFLGIERDRSQYRTAQRLLGAQLASPGRE